MRQTKTSNQGTEKVASNMYIIGVLWQRNRDLGRTILKCTIFNLEKLGACQSDRVCFLQGPLGMLFLPALDETVREKNFFEEEGIK